MGYTSNVSNSKAPVYINVRQFSYFEIVLMLGATAIVVGGGAYFLAPIIAAHGGTIVLAAAIKLGITRQAC